MEISFYEEAQKVWSKISQDSAAVDFNFEIELNKKALDFFNVGNFYFYLFDVRNATFKHISPEITAVLGYTPESMDVNFFMSKIHPDDQSAFLNNESQAVVFFKKLPNDKIPKYKVVYDYRVKNSSGNYIRILQQVVVVQYDDDKNVLMTLGVHSDISFLKKNNTPCLSFIGLDGEPSFTDVAITQNYKKPDETFTKREKDIINCLLAGDQTQEIAIKLCISKHTVDTHRRNILSKTNTRNTLELALKVMSEKLL